MAGIENVCKCHAIYNEHGHIKQRAKKERFLGSKRQFCAAFYHVHEWEHRQESRKREHFCLDENKCIVAQEAKELIKKFVDDAKKFAKIAKKFAEEAGLPEEDKELLEEEAELLEQKAELLEHEAEPFDVKEANEFAEQAKSFGQKKKQKLREKLAEVNQISAKANQLKKTADKAAYAWCAQARKVVAVVKFEKVDRRILYEARYTNCGREKKHAEDFFKEDIENENGVLA